MITKLFILDTGDYIVADDEEAAIQAKEELQQQGMRVWIIYIKA